MNPIGMVILGFLSGSIMYSYCLPKWLLRKDVRKGTGDENPGGYNAYNIHKGLGLVCILMDMLKGFVPVCIFVKHIGISSPWTALMLTAPCLGHAFTPMLKGKGGKALSTAAGSMLGLLPVSRIGLLLIAMAFFFSYVVVINPFETRVVTVMLGFDLILLTLKLDNIWIDLGSWGMTWILWYKQLEKRLPERKPISWSLVRR